MELMKRSVLARLWQLILLEKKEVTAIYFYAVLSGLLQLSLPIGIQAIIGFVLGASMVTSIYVLIVLVVLGVLFVGIFQMNQMKLIEKIQQNIFTRFAFQFAEALPRMDLIHVDHYYMPEKVNRFFDTQNVQKGLSKILLDLPTASIQVLFGLILLSLYHPFFIVFGLILIFLLWLILRLTSSRGLSTSIEESNYKYGAVAWLEEIARVIKSFKYSQGTDLNLIKTDKSVISYLGARTAHFKVLLLQYQTLVAFKVGITVSMLTVGTALLLNQQLNIGEFIAAEIVILTVINAVEKLISSLDSVYDVITGLEKLASVTEIPSEKSGTFTMSKPAKGVSVTINHLSFGYHPPINVLKDINLQIEAGQKICISGEEGSGKSTLLNLLSGNYSQFDGAILLNNIPINNINLASLRSYSGIYFNQNDIFKGSVWENISLQRANVHAEKVIQLAQDLGFGSFINQLPDGFETQLDANGKRLAGTLVRKILILRALAHDPAVLLLEEPWQGLEPEVKDKMMEYLLSQEKLTVVVISNSKQFGQKCHQQVFLKNGEIDFVLKNK